MNQQITIDVWGQPETVDVQKRSESVWIATGRYNGQPHEGEGRTAQAAAEDWRYWACKASG